MKRFSKLLLILTLSVTLLLSSCSAQPKSFTVEEITITLTNRFSKLEQEGFTAVYGSLSAAVMLTREEFALFEGTTLSADSTVEEYAESVIDAQELKNVEIKTEDGLTYFIYDGSADGVTYTYLATVHKSKDAFWLIQFGTKADRFANAKSEFMTFAKSVTFAA